MSFRWAGFAGLLVLFVAFGLPDYIATHRSDVGTNDDSDLSVVDIKVSYEDNALSYLREAAEACKWGENARAIRLAMFDGERGLDEAARNVVGRNRVALAKLEKALEAPHFRLSESESVTMDFAPEIPVSTGNLIELLEVRALLASHQGEWESAFADANRILRLAQKIEGANGAVLTTTMMSVAIRGSGLGTLRELIRTAPLDAEQALRWTQSLNDFPQ